MAAGLSVVVGVAGLVLSLWPLWGIATLAAASGLLATGFVIARAAHRERRALGHGRWPVIAAYVVNGLAAVVVSASVLAGGALSGFLLLAPHLPALAPQGAAPSCGRATLEEEASTVLVIVAIVGAVVALDAMSHDEDAGSSGEDAPSAEPSPERAASADASRASSEGAAVDDGPPIFGLAMLGLGLVGATEYLWEHRGEVSLAGGLLALVLLVCAFSDDDAPDGAAAASDEAGSTPSHREASR